RCSRAGPSCCFLGVCSILRRAGLLSGVVRWLDSEVRMRQFVFAAAVVALVGCAESPPENNKVKAENPDEAFHNPVDNKTYVAQGGWKSYKPDEPRPDDPNSKVKTDQIRLLTSQDDIAARTTVKELASFIKEAERLAEESFRNSEKQFRLMVQFNCKP